ncbi:NAD-dependent epimerase [Shewanella intestini]|uniref:NAD-dependent epimerase n=1 Tax=Shewanella intestini TaxID=2017544 RepID=A0ABS5HYV7_9GAMM|nr:MULTISPECIES: NAD-dependent epimerase [Shewanella]MBR9726738.1 NAD-dependent epimerase [Shewanella intestini]MRG34696.1 NAD-dependent epimerase/dehydratase family protein [Shewanella sp. XMDDZSB0408]
MKYLVTGAAGFIGSAVCLRLCEQGFDVVGIDNLNDYYDVSLKLDRVKLIESHSNFRFLKQDIFHRDEIAKLFETEKFDYVIHLGAQAGVRYSIDNPHTYADTNLIGHINILEGCRNNQVKHLVYASSSSVYGLNEKQPFQESDAADHPISLYAASKRANELISHTYSHLYDLPTTGLRFFTVYGPWGRPDMAPYKFAKAIIAGETIDIYNFGDMSRDFTFIDDIVDGIMGVRTVIPTRTQDTANLPNRSSAPYAIYNIGNGSPVKLMDFIGCLEKEFGIEASKNLMAQQPGDVTSTWASTEALYQVTGYKAKTSITQGVKQFVAWYREYYQV